MMKKISLKTASGTCVVIAIMTIICHLLVILRKIPFTWVNGGLLTTYEDAFKSAIVGIIVLLLSIPIYLIRGSWIKFNKFERPITILLWGMFIFGCIGTVMQLSGTLFEKMLMSILCGVNTLMTFRLIHNKDA